MTFLGRLERVPLRGVWANEATGFTPWLAAEPNLALLADAVGLDLELEAQEKDVGRLRADLLCKDTITGNWVLIENQLERTDHSHLGQLLTYAAGLDAVTIIWVAERFTDEHRAAMDWLNEVTSETINFFGLEIELWRIEGSPVAPKFNVVSKPNDWTKRVAMERQAVQAGAPTETKQTQQEYWAAVGDVLRERKSVARPQKGLPQNWMNVSVGRSGFNLAASMNTRDRWIAVMLVMNGADAKAHFHELRQQAEQLESSIGDSLMWEEVPHRKESRVTIRLDGCDPMDRVDWPRQHAWLAETLERYHRTFHPIIKQLGQSETLPDGAAQ